MTPYVPYLILSHCGRNQQIDSQDQIDRQELFLAFILQRSGSQRPQDNALFSHWMDSVWEHCLYSREVGSTVTVIFFFCLITLSPQNLFICSKIESASFDGEALNKLRSSDNLRNLICFPTICNTIPVTTLEVKVKLHAPIAVTPG